MRMQNHDGRPSPHEQNGLEGDLQSEGIAQKESSQSRPSLITHATGHAIMVDRKQFVTHRWESIADVEDIVNVSNDHTIASP